MRDSSGIPPVPGTTAPLTVAAELLEGFARDILVAAGLSPQHAAIVADCLTYADLCGLGSHGISRLPIYARRIAEGIVNPRSQPSVLEGAAAALRVVDGDNGPGAVVGSFAMQQAVAAAKQNGVGLVLVRASNHFGVGAYYSRMAAAEGCLGICGSNAPPNVAVWGASEAAFGTNPLAIAAPAGRYDPINLDMSTSTVAKGKILVHARQGKPIPEGWALDPDGHPTTDAARAAAGVMLPFGGPKGSGLALAVDLIAGVMSGAAFGDGVRDQYTDFTAPQDVGHFFLAVDIGQALPMESYTTRVEALYASLKAKRPAAGVKEVLLPGENKARQEREHRERGISIDPVLERELDELADQQHCSRLRSRSERPSVDDACRTDGV
jgi:LDH2 family malate/lactate/ureidoglycolate dehydrogenase